MPRPEFVYVTYIETTPEKLWQALTSSEFSKRYWFNTELRSDFKVGSPFALVMDGTTTDVGEILEADPPRRLSYTFHHVLDRDGAERAADQGGVHAREARQAGQADADPRELRRGQPASGRHLQGMAGDPGQPQEPAGNRHRAGDPVRRARHRGHRNEHRPVQADDGLHHLHRLDAGEGVGGADIGRIFPEVFFRQFGRGRAEGRRRLHRAHAGRRAAYLAAR